jgi:hypothetical protein
MNHILVYFVNVKMLFSCKEKRNDLEFQLRIVDVDMKKYVHDKGFVCSEISILYSSPHPFSFIDLGSSKIKNEVILIKYSQPIGMFPVTEFTDATRRLMATALRNPPCQNHISKRRMKYDQATKCQCLCSQLWHWMAERSLPLSPRFTSTCLLSVERKMNRVF